MNLFFKDQGTSLNRGTWVVLGNKWDEKEWKRSDNGERSYLKRGNLKTVFLDLQNKERRSEVEPTVAGDHTSTLKSAT